MVSLMLFCKIRWVVESVNGRLKRWKYLANIIPNSQIPYIAEDIKLVGAICKRYKPPLNVGNQEEDQVLAAKMKTLAAKGNTLLDRVTEERLDRRNSSWKRMDDADVMEDFPILSEEELTNITLGVYQLKMAKSYSKEHVAEDWNYDIMLNNDIEGVLRVKIQSRHTSAKSYMLWIEYDEVLIKGWYCQCKAGARVVGACAHVSSVLWYLGFARHNTSIDDVKNWSNYLEDASHVPVVIDDNVSGGGDVEE